mmetsp:Transcript_1324/g.2106  ORF Transcript_1324/g.2106 Transcript_1324/m.2106 type:complete len:497 (-) Transcript_1324:272-1762(-)
MSLIDVSRMAPPCKDSDMLEPEEGLLAWLNVLGSFTVQFITLGGLYTFSLFVTTYVDEFQVESADVSLVYVLQAAIFFGGGIVPGSLADKYGIRPVVLTGALLSIAALVLGSFSTELWHITATQGLMLGMGSAFLYWPVASVVPQWFSKRRAFAQSLAALGGGAGNFVLGLGLQQIIDTYGFRAALRGLALVYLLAVLPCAFVMRRRLPVLPAASSIEDWQVLRSPSFRILLLSQLFANGYQIPFFALSPYVEELGFDKDFAALAVSMTGIGSSAGRLMLGCSADYLGRLRNYKTSLFGTALVCCLWGSCTTRTAILGFAFSFGFFSGGFNALISIVVSEFHGTERLGSLLGYISLAAIPFSILGPYLGGMFFDLTGSYRATAVFTAVLTTLGAVIQLLQKEQPKLITVPAKVTLVPGSEASDYSCELSLGCEDGISGEKDLFPFTQAEVSPPDANLPQDVVVLYSENEEPGFATDGSVKCHPSTDSDGQKDRISE